MGINKPVRNRDVAIIGMAVRFPKSDDTDMYWENLKNGIDCVGSFPDSRRTDTDQYVRYMALAPDDTQYLKGSYLESINMFDYDLFRLSPREASLMDPNQRLFLEIAYSAIEDAGYATSELAGTRTGVYIGFPAQFTRKGYSDVITEIEPSAIPISFAGNIPSIIAGRVSYFLNLRGPALLFDTACSSSLVALHYAYRDVRNGDCDMAIAGGCRIRMLPMGKGVVEGIESPDNRTRTFDDLGNGVGVGEGVAAVVLKSYKKAIEDGDNIYAVIKGSAVNQDGRSVGMTAPNAAAQEDVIVRAWEDAEIDPETISYIEAHGTATKLGDPTEILGVRKAFRRYTQKSQFCAIGSVKTNMGHLLGAAGIAGLIKAVLALKNRQIPPSINFNRPNQKIKFEDSPVYVNDELMDWDMDESIRRCGVSSFGISGTNCHIVLEEPLMELDVAARNIDDKELPFILTLSAKNNKVLKTLVFKYARFLKNEKFSKPYDLCYTANTGRNHFNCRLAIKFYGIDDLIEKLTNIDNSEIENLTLESVFYNEYKVVAVLNCDETAGEVTAAQKNEMTKTAREKLNEFLSESCYKSVTAEEICKLYVKGADVNWNLLYNKDFGRRISLPTYPFDRKRCWIDIPEDIENGNSNFYYTVDWCRRESETTINRDENSSLLIFMGNNEIGNSIEQLLVNRGRKVITAVFGTEYNKISNNRYVIKAEQQDFIKLMKELKDVSLSKIIHLSTLSNDKEIESVEELQVSQSIGVMSLFYLVKSIILNNITSKINIVLVAKYVSEVTGDERTIYPENATLFGLAKVIGMEQRNLSCKCIDIDENINLNDLLIEVECSDSYSNIAIRDNKRYVEEIKKLDINSFNTEDISFKQEGAYIITGGLGGLGLEMAKFLASKSCRNIILINRTAIPERGQWNNILVSKGETIFKEKIRKIKETESLGANVVVYNADVANYTRMKQVVGELKDKYKRINGVIHSAGIGSEGFIYNKKEETFVNTLMPKVYGTYILNKLLMNDEMDFFICFSSITSVTGGLGQGDYTAANAYLDTFQAYRNKLGKRTLTINWTGWEEVGMAKRYGVNVDGTFRILSTNKAIDLFSNAISRNMKRVIIGEINFDYISHNHLNDDFDYKLSNSLKKYILQNITPAKKHQGTTEQLSLTTTRLIGKNPNNLTYTEKLLAQIWGKVLGYNQLDIRDNFFEIGGDSILAVRMEVELEKNGIHLKSYDVFRYPTIELMAEQIGEKVEIKRPSIVLDNIEPFNDLYYKNCFYNSFFSIINHYRKNIIPFITNDIIVYKYNEDLDGERFGVDFIETKSIKALMGEIGLQVETKPESENVVKDVISAIEKGRPVIIWVDCYYEPIRKDTFQEIHWPHTWLIYGFDKVKAMFDIVEHTHRQNLTYDKRTISFEDAARCYEGYLSNFPKDSDKTYYEFYLSESSKDSFVECDYCRSTLAKSIKKYEDAVRKGIEQVPVIIDYLKKVITDESEFKLRTEELLGYLNDIINAKKIEKYRIDKLFNDQVQLYELLGSLIGCWDSLRLTIAKYMYSNVYNQSTLNKAIEKLSQIHCLEVEYLEVVLKLSK